MLHMRIKVGIVYFNSGILMNNFNKPYDNASICHNYYYCPITVFAVKFGNANVVTPSPP
jgi:hypothetical protein